jgi:H+/gluconate symporter-like permease
MMGGYGAFILFVGPLVTATGIAVTGRIWEWWRARRTGDIQDTDTDTTDTTDTDATEPLLLDLGTDTDTTNAPEVEPLLPSPGPMASVRDVAAAVGQAAMMGALASTAIVVYKYRKWQRSRRT